VTPLVDVKPYIVVDNERIYPIEGSTSSASVTEKLKKGEEQEYGIVDRVTISDAARAKSKLFQTQAQFNEPVKTELSNKLPDRRKILLYCLPKLKS
jgi:phosphohistidine phosphatase SixA